MDMDIKPNFIMVSVDDIRALASARCQIRTKVRGSGAERRSLRVTGNKPAGELGRNRCFGPHFPLLGNYSRLLCLSQSVDARLHVTCERGVRMVLYQRGNGYTRRAHESDNTPASRREFPLCFADNVRNDTSVGFLLALLDGCQLCLLLLQIRR